MEYNIYMNNGDIYKSAGIVVKERKILVEKSFGKDFYFSPGGKLEKNETNKEALIRELFEEFRIKVRESDLEFFEHYDSPATGQEDRMLHMDVFIVIKYKGEVTEGDGVESILWVNSKTHSDVPIGSIIVKQIIPKLKELDIID